MAGSISLAGPNAFAVFGGSFNPPGLHHLALARHLTQCYGNLILVPCGFRNDKVRQDQDWVDSGLRRRLMDLAFRPLVTELAISGLSLELDYLDLDRDRFTPTIELAEIYKARGTPHFVVGADLVLGGADGKAPIQAQWYRGQEIWQNLHWIVVNRPGFALGQSDLPPNCTVIVCNIDGSSSQIRQRLRAGQTITGLVSPDLEALLIERRAYV